MIFFMQWVKLSACFLSCVCDVCDAWRCDAQERTIDTRCRTQCKRCLFSIPRRTTADRYFLSPFLPVSSWTYFNDTSPVTDYSDCGSLKLNLNFTFKKWVVILEHCIMGTLYNVQTRSIQKKKTVSHHRSKTHVVLVYTH